MEFLHANTKSLLDSAHADGQYISAAGKNVVVIGGGDTGTDCVGTALRHGARERRPARDPPAPAGQARPRQPLAAVAEGLQARLRPGGGGRAAGRRPARWYAVQTKRFVGDAEGHVREVHTVDVEWRKAPRRPPRTPTRSRGRERVVPAELVLLALGFLGPESRGLVEELGLKLDERGNVVTDGEKMTSVPGVFAAGDMVRGQSLVVWAIDEGRKAARGVDRYLMYGETYLP